MSDASLLRKIVGPTLPAALLHRTDLLAQLREAIVPESQPESAAVRYKLVLCCAPAGYGKTTLLADFMRSTSFPCCWYFLEPGDTDPVVFLRTLLASLRQAFPQFGASLDPVFRTLDLDALSSTVSRYYIVLNALCVALANEVSEHFALILSNYEEINESEILAGLINYLLKNLPPQGKLIIESRVTPNISFTTFVINNEICGLNYESLRFSAQEITELTRLRGLPPLTEAEAEHLATSFDGWIAGILLGTRIGDTHLRRLTQRTLQNERLSSLPGRLNAEHKRTMLFTYVVDAVFKQDAEVAAFLQTISILQQIEPDICNALCASRDAAERLVRLERRGLFLTSYENSTGMIYTCHPVIRHLLSEQLQNHDPERFLALHRQAAILWHARGDDEQAMYHALTSGAFDLAVSLILDISEHLLQQGRRETIVRWLSALPTTVQENHPQLLLLQATIVLGHGQYASALPLLDKAEALMSASDEREKQAFGARVAVMRSKALFQTGAYLQAQELCQRVLQEAPEQDRALRAAAEMRLGLCASLQGHFNTGITHLQRALHIWMNQPPLVQAMELHRALANVYYLTGNFLLAKHHLSLMLDFCKQSQDVLEKNNVLVVQGLIAQDQGLATEAEAAFLQALQLARTFPHQQRGEAYALVNLASLAVEQGHYSQALLYVEQGLALAQTFGNRSLVNDARMSQALSYLFLGDPISALLAADQMEISTSSEEGVGYERVWHDLTIGLIHLTQKRVTEAVTYLAPIEKALNVSNLQRARFQAKLRLAASRVLQEQAEQAVDLLQEVASLLAAHPNYLHLLHIELHWLPMLASLVHTHPRLGSLRILLHLDKQPLPQNQQDNSLPTPASIVTSTPSLTIWAFGEPTVLLDGQPIKRWRIALVKELFFFLLGADHSLSKEAILTALWSNDDERATKSFHITLYHLRKLFGEASVVFQAGGYRLELAACYGERVFYDVQAFRQHQVEAEQALTLGDDVRAKEALLSMVQLYRGDYGSAFYSDWCTFQRDELRTAYLEARRQLAQICWRAETWNESAEHWRQMLHLDACLEEAHYGLMRCHIRQGKRGAALRQYQTCQKVLEEELGVQPGQALQKLHQWLTTKQHVE